MRVLWAVLLVTVSLAGCSATVPAATVERCDEDACIATVDTLTPEGVLEIRGVIVDQTITPISGARVVLQRPGGEALANVSTNDVGAFTFRGVEEAFYGIVASAPGHLTTNVQIDVTPGMSTVRIMLGPDPTPSPYHILVAFDGLMGCSARAWGWVQLCSLLDALVGDPFGDASAVSFWDPLNAEGRQADFLQTEMVWESTQALGGGLTMMIDANVQGSWYGTSLATVEGGSPLAFALDDAAIRTHGIGAAGSDGISRGIGVQVWSGQHEYPVGATYQQDFEMFLTATYGFAPATGWMFVTDGEPT